MKCAVCDMEIPPKRGIIITVSCGKHDNEPDKYALCSPECNITMMGVMYRSAKEVAEKLRTKNDKLSISKSIM